MRRILKRIAVGTGLALALIVFIVGGRILINRRAQAATPDIIVGAAPSAAQNPPSGMLLVGTASAAITPQTSAYIAGYRPNRVSTGIDDDLLARVIVIQDAGGAKIVFATVDLIGIIKHDADAIRSAIAKLGIPAEAVFIAASHQHSGPDMIGYWGRRDRLMSGRNNRYIRFVAQTIVDLTEQALLQMRPASLAYFEASASGLCKNDRNKLRIDNRARTLLLRRPDNAVLATLVNFGCHPETADRRTTMISADYPGALRTALELRYGGTALFVNGALGAMVSPTTEHLRNKKRGPEMIREMGTALADSVSARISSAKAIADPRLAIYRRTVSVPLENKIFTTMTALGIIPRSAIRGTAVETEVALVAIGPVIIAMVPGEIEPFLAARIREQLAATTGAKDIMLWTLVNDEIGYILTEEDYPTDRYKYERSMSLGPQTGPLLEGAFAEMANEYVKTRR